MYRRLSYLLLITCLTSFIILPAQAWEAKKGPLKTEWGEKVTSENAWTEYPRPQMVRENWTNLNGLWNYAITKKDVGEVLPTKWDGDILVPFPVESQLSGVMKKIWPDKFLWYKRTVNVEKKDNKIYLLHFGAVDYEAIVWINGKKAGRHTGGNTPFRFDITDLLVSGDNEISIRVFDQSDNRSSNNYQLVGKQTLRPSHIRYIAATGIWQTTWLEEVPEGYIDRLRINTAHNPATITVKAFAKGKGGDKIRVTARFKRKKAAKVEGPLDGVTLEIKKAKLWDTENPNLYDLKIELLKGRKVIDTVESYAGIRTIGKVRDAQGNLRFTLNDKVVFHWGPLDQGWWPDGLLAPPSDAAILADIKAMKAYGFNMVRSHIKVNPLRYYYHCDKEGIMVWQDQVSGGPGPKYWSRLRTGDRRPADKVWPEEHQKQFIAEFKEMVDELYNAPSIVSWVPFNESWGQHNTMETGEWIIKYDSSRLINIASGGNFFEIGDVVDGHSYPDPGFPVNDKKFKDYIKVVGEFGGYGFEPSVESLWRGKKGGHGYGGNITNAPAFKARLQVGIDKLYELKKKGVAGAVYTQITDVEGEINGLITYDRKIKKISPKNLNKLSEKLLAPLE